MPATQPAQPQPCHVPGSVRLRVERFAEQIGNCLEEYFWLWAALFLTVFLAWSLQRDTNATMWIDELYTLHMARQASPAEIVNATIQGCDGAPPLYAILVHELLSVFPMEALAVRLPATLGYCAMLVCLLVYGRRRFTAVYTWVIVFAACNATFYYATEGRSYGVVLGAAAGILLCWSAAVEHRLRPLAIVLLTVCAALMVAMHYYAIFFLVPFCFAELLRWRNSGKPDYLLLPSLSAALLVLALHSNLIRASRSFQAHFWSPASLAGAFDFYSQHCVPVLLLCLLPIVVVAVYARLPATGFTQWTGLKQSEWIIAGGLFAMPIPVVIVSIFTTHVFVERYTLWAAVGLAILVAAVICQIAGQRAAVGVALLVPLGVLLAVNEIQLTGGQSLVREGAAAAEALKSLPAGAEPVVIADHHLFMELAYYAAPALKPRLIYPVSRQLDLRYFGYDTGALLMSALSHRLRLQILPYDDVLSANREFLLAVTAKDYLPWHLLASGYRLVPIGSHNPPVLYQVSPEK